MGKDTLLILETSLYRGVSVQSSADPGGRIDIVGDGWRIDEASTGRGNRFSSCSSHSAGRGNEIYDGGAIAGLVTSAGSGARLPAGGHAVHPVFFEACGLAWVSHPAGPGHPDHGAKTCVGEALSRLCLCPGSAAPASSGQACQREARKTAQFASEGD